MRTNTQPIPLMILTGFLGAGKTTVLIGKRAEISHGALISIRDNLQKLRNSYVDVV